MDHLRDMIQRLPHLYRDGELVKDLLSQAAVQLEIWDQDAREVQKAHWFDAALELEEAARLGALLDIQPEDWQSLGEFRAWLHAYRNARLRYGSVTIEAMRRFVHQYVRDYQNALDFHLIPALDPDSWPPQPIPGLPFFDENPEVLRHQRIPPVGGLEPLERFDIDQKGLDETPAGFLMVALGSAHEYVPVLVNTTRGEALVFRGTLAPGQRLWLVPGDDGTLTGRLERQDVTHRLYSVTGAVPGQSWASAEGTTPARAITLGRGLNQLWFLPLAHYDEEGLDRFLLSLPDMLMRQGRYDRTELDHSLFFQPPAVILYTLWHESQPATFSIRLPAGALRSRADHLPEALSAMERLEFSLNQGIDQLAAAGVRNDVTLQSFQETQPLGDYLTAVMPHQVQEVGPTGADSLPDAGGLFSVTEFENSTFE